MGIGALDPLITYLNSCKERVDVDVLANLLANAQVASSAVADFKKFSEETYTRNTVSKTDSYELLVICWKPGQHSQIHDHQGSSCAFKVIEGVSTEEVFAVQSDGYVLPTAERSYQCGEVCVAQTSDIHRISNRSQKNNLITLHIYSPPLTMTTYQVMPAVAVNQ